MLVVTLTGGERGDILNPAMDLPEGTRPHRRYPPRRDGEGRRNPRRRTPLAGLRGLRPAEGDPPPPLPDGCFALVPLESRSPNWSGHPRLPPARHDHLRRERRLPAPDHIRCHQVSVAAFEAAGDYRLHPDAGSPWTVNEVVLQPRIPAGAHADAPGRVRQERAGGPFARWLEHWDPEFDVHAGRVTTRVPCSRVLHPARRGAQAHATQIDPHRILLRHPHRVAAAVVADRGVRVGALPCPRSTA